MRRPVRTITLPSIPSRMMRLGLPTSSAPSGVIVAALIPSPASTIAAAASSQTWFFGLAAVLEREVEALLLDLEPDHAGVQDSQRLLQQLLARLVALEHDYREPGHGARA